ncbi:general secretion pathway protein GspB [Shewanella electrodiphila]|uniref:General secretion pathway protein GspB n=1 Tax=Shewanella electrodiphila TaxID=934143 RepID=A0ABT0KJH3_9GAMM|nr:general secretion pathway protein GspB [Shewanella electrodiphila]MCL1043990.1 general secretion pathway protein GspB [Shewanella electrodiphila]
MSILLDAVTKEKQQQMGELPDAVLTPRANYQQVNGHRPWLKYVLLAVVIALGIASAWGLSKLIVPTSNIGQAKETQNNTGNEQTQTSQSQSMTPARRSSETQSEVRIANKVALPIAKSLSQVNGTTQYVSRSSQPATNETTYDYRLSNQGGEMTPSQSSGQSSQQYQTEPKQQSQADNRQAAPAKNQSVSRNVDAEASGANQLTAAELQALYGDDAIILGANSNYKKTSDLDALRMKVSAAASDVNYEQQSQTTSSIDASNTAADDASNANNLMAAFEAALKEVEYESSANAPVTEEKLDPIPTTSKDEIPSYGQLPASVQLRVPEFNIQAHVYSSAAENRWLNVDGEELQEGDSIQGSLNIIEIRPRDVVLEIDGEKFKVPAI